MKKTTRANNIKQIFGGLIALSLILLFMSSCTNDQHSNENFPENENEISQSDAKAEDILDEEQTSDYNPVDKMLSETLMYPSQNDEWNYNVYETYIEITGYIGGASVETVVVPEKIENLPVKAFTAHIYDANSIKLPKTLIMLGSRDSYGALFGDELTSIDLPEGLIEIGEKTFEHCDNLSNIQFPSTLRKIGASAFEGCDSLTTLTIPASMEEIGAGAFFINGYSNLEDVYILNQDVRLDVSNLVCKTIHGYPGSTAAAYASKSGIAFKIIEG